MTEKQKHSSTLHFIGGGLGGLVGSIVTCPLEVVKTRLQSSMYVSKSSKLFSITDTLNVIRLIYAQEGIGALWKGLPPQLVGVIPSRAIYFATYSKVKHTLATANGKETPFVHCASAIAASSFTATMTNPIWVVKTRMQLQSSHGERLYKNSLHCLWLLIKNEGRRGIFRGISASYLGAAESTIQWVLYEKLKKNLTQGEKTWVDWLEYFGVAASSKLIASAMTYPHEVIRTRMRQPPQTTGFKYPSVVKTFKTIVKEESVRALYGGMTAHLMRVVPNAAILFLSYELVLHGFA